MPLYNNPINYMPNIQEQERNTKLECTLAQLFAQVEGSHSGERDSRSGELRSPRRELDISGTGPNALARLGELSSPERGILSLKNQDHSLERQLAQQVWASLCQSRLGEPDSLGRDYSYHPCSHLQQ